MLTPLFACTALVLSYALPWLGLLLVAETRKANDESLYLTTTTKEDRFKWAALGWILFTIGLVAAPVPFVVMALSGYEGWYIVMMFLVMVDMCFVGELDDILPEYKKPVADPALTEPKMV